MNEVLLSTNQDKVKENNKTSEVQCREVTDMTHDQLSGLAETMKFITKEKDGSFAVDFKGDRAKERSIGLAQLFMAHVLYLEVIDRNEKKRIGKRETKMENRYYHTDKEGYIPVFSGAKIHICSEQEYQANLKEEIPNKLSQQPSSPRERRVVLPATSSAEIKKWEGRTNVDIFHNGDCSLADLSPEQTYALAKEVFGNGSGAALLIHLDKKYGGTGTLIKREIAIGIHEKGLKFGPDTNQDPGKGYATGTFQIWGKNRSESLVRYNRSLQKGIQYYQQENIQPSIIPNELTDADKDVISHIGYILSERGGEGTLQQLGNDQLGDAETGRLMAYKIQGVAEVGKDARDFVAMVNREGVRVQTARLDNNPDTLAA